MSQPNHTVFLDKIKSAFSRCGGKKKSSSSAASSALTKAGEQVARTDLAVASTSATTPPTITTLADTTPRDVPAGQNRGVPETSAVLKAGGSSDAAVQARGTVAVGNSITTSNSDGSIHDLVTLLSGSPDTSAVQIANSASEAIENVGTDEAHAMNNASRVVDDKLWYKKNTPKWNEAVVEWKAGHVEEFAKILLSAKAANGNAADGSGDWLLKLRPAKKSSKQTAARLKRWQPVLASVRGIVMAGSAADPHKIAPIVCASVLFGLDILFNCMNPEDRDKILDILCQCGNTINECNNFEINFLKASHPLIESKMPKVNELLVKQYSTALDLAFKLRHACQSMQWDFVESTENQTAGQNNVSQLKESRAERFGDWFKSRGSLLWMIMNNEVLEWQGGSNELSRLKSDWAVVKDDLKETIAAGDQTVAARDWLRKKDYPDPSPADIRNRVMKHDGYGNGADWFLKGDEFTAFRNGFRFSKKADHTQNSKGPPGEPQAVSEISTQKYLAAKRVLWLHGGYGTGKSTILYHTYLDLSTDADPQLESADDLRVIPYFCNGAEIGSKRADCETIIRALVRRMALSPDLTLAKPANDMYIKHNSATAQDGELTLLDHWQPLFEKLIEINRGKCHFVLLVDGLDECADPSDWEELLNILNAIMKEYANVSLICSSHAHVNVGSIFALNHKEASTDIVAAVHVTGGKTAVAIKAYIAGELKRRKPKAWTSVFYQEQHKQLLADFEKLLLANANGNFRWVEIWLELLIPETIVHGKKGKPIQWDELARKRLKELEEDTTPNFDPDQRLQKAYQRLWDLNSTVDLEFAGDIRTRLFQLVQVAAKPLDAQGLSAILRIRTKDYATYPEVDIVKSMFANFLEEYEASPSSLDPMMHLRYEDYARAVSTPLGHKHLRYVHESARDFVVNLCRSSGGDVKCSKTSRQMYEKQSHLSIVEVYIDIFANHAHQIWEALHIDPLKWRDVFQRPLRYDRLNIPYASPQWHAFTYLATYGFYHCHLAADRRSLFDPVWQKVFNRVILPSESAFGMIIAMPDCSLEGLGVIHSTIKTDELPVVRKEQDRLEILPAHVLALLNIIHEDDLNVPFDTSDIGAASTADNNYVTRASLFQHADNVDSYMSITALQLACMTRNCAAVRMIFQAAPSYCEDPLKSLVLNESSGVAVPFAIAIKSRHFKLAGTLLELEKSVTSVKDFGADSPSASKFVSKQWSCRTSDRGDESGKCLLFLAWDHFKSSNLCRLLEIAQPVDINASDKEGKTLLHRAAADGDQTTVDFLVDKCGANPDAKTDLGPTRAMCAATAGHSEIEFHLQPRGRN